MEKIRKKRTSLKVIAIIVSFILICLGTTALYVNDYYHADEYAEQCISETAEGITIDTGIDNELIFSPDITDENNTGLIFYPGGKVEYTAYAPLMCKLAAKGITCILVQMPYNLAILDTNIAQRVKDKYPEIKQWYLSGHSLGGSAATICLKDNAGDYEGVILLGAYSAEDISKTELSVLAIYGDCDKIMDQRKYEKRKAYLPENVTEYVIKGGCHAYFGSYGDQKGDGKAECTSSEQQEITASVIVDWIKSRN